MRIAVSILISTVLLFSGSCGVYTFSPSAVGGIQTIAIPLFDNQTLESGIGEKLADGLAQAFVSDNTLRVVPEGRSDSILRGSILSYDIEAYTYTESEQVSEYIVTIAVSVQFMDTKNDKVIWEDKHMSDWGTYASSGETEYEGQDRAIAKMVEDILNRTVKGW